jgi:hypothetical protein
LGICGSAENEEMSLDTLYHPGKLSAEMQEAGKKGKLPNTHASSGKAEIAYTGVDAT